MRRKVMFLAMIMFLAFFSLGFKTQARTVMMERTRQEIFEDLVTYMDENLTDNEEVASWTKTADYENGVMSWTAYGVDHVQYLYVAVYSNGLVYLNGIDETGESTSMYLDIEEAAAEWGF